MARIPTHDREHPIAKAERAAWLIDVAEILREQSLGAPAELADGIRWAADFLDTPPPARGGDGAELDMGTA